MRSSMFNGSRLTVVVVRSRPFSSPESVVSWSRGRLQIKPSGSGDENGRLQIKPSGSGDENVF